MTTLDLDREAETFIRDHHCIPGFLGYDGLPELALRLDQRPGRPRHPRPQVISDGDLVGWTAG